MEAQCYNVANSESQLIIDSPCNRRPKLSCWPSTTLKIWYPDDLVLKDSSIQSTNDSKVSTFEATAVDAQEFGLGR